MVWVISNALSAVAAGSCSVSSNTLECGCVWAGSCNGTLPSRPGVWEPLLPGLCLTFLSLPGSLLLCSSSAGNSSLLWLHWEYRACYSGDVSDRPTPSTRVGSRPFLSEFHAVLSHRHSKCSLKARHFFQSLQSCILKVKQKKNFSLAAWIF